MSGAATQKALPFAPGPVSASLFAEEQGYLTPGLQKIAVYSRLALARGEGAWLYDEDGGRYLDFVAGICVASIGHGHPEHARALFEQAARLSVGSFTTRNRVEFLRRLARLTPPGLDRCQLYSSGAEAVEAALRLAKSHTKGYEVVGFWGGFHGKTGGVLGLLGDEFKKRLGPWAPGVYLAPYPNPYRCPLGEKSAHDCAAHCLEFLREMIRRATAGALAAVIAEPVQGTAGNVIPADGFLRGLRQLTQELGALWISDEMITGFGRTGLWFGCQHEGAVPDVLTVGKGMAGGFPVSGLLTTAALAQAKPFADPSGSSSSYGGNPLAAAACNATLRVLEGERLVENSREVGAFLLGRLEKLSERFGFVGDVRGRGLLIGVELVADRKSKAPLPTEICREIFDEALRRGLLTMAYSPVIRINPPLTLTRREAEQGAGLLEEAFAAVAKRRGL